LLAKLQERESELAGEIEAKGAEQDENQQTAIRLHDEKQALLDERNRIATRIMAARQAVTAGIGANMEKPLVVVTP
jgi:hypothetical protein